MLKANVTKVFQMRPAKPKAKRNRQAPTVPSRAAAGDIEDALANEIFRVTNQRPCAGCGP